jgi:hypothetical protein
MERETQHGVDGTLATLAVAQANHPAQESYAHPLFMQLLTKQQNHGIT